MLRYSEIVNKRGGLADCHASIYVMKLVTEENLPRFHHKASLHFVLEPACLQVSADAAQHERSVDLTR